MNYSWIAYKNALQELPKYIPPEHGEYERVFRLQSSLIDNIAQAQQQNDSPELYTNRKLLVLELDSTMKQASDTSFIELCIFANPAFGYLTFVYQTSQLACRVFSSKRVWPSQCKDITKRFGERPMIDNIVIGISGTTQSSLHYIDGCISNLVQLIEDFEKRCPRLFKPIKSLQKKQGDILGKLAFFVMEVRTLDHSSFEELICIWQEIIATQPSTVSLAPSFSFLKNTRPFSSPNDTTEGQASLSKDQADVTDSKKQYEDINQQLKHSEVKASAQRQMMEKMFGKDSPRIQGERTNNELHNRLVTLLLKVPDIGNPATRSALLRGIPNNLSLPRDYTNPHTDISGLVSSLAPIQLTNGHWILLILIENALSRLEDTMDGEQLKDLRLQIEASFQATDQR